MFLRYYEAGFVPIPIAPNSKRPVTAAEGFNIWAHEGIPRAKIEEFEEKFPLSKSYGIGIVCGRASNICVVDIDTDDIDILQRCPPSPVRRRGQKGEARFFQYNPDLVNRAFTKKNDRGKKIAGCDILVESKYIIVPPSIHPNTGKPYFWLTPEDLFDLGASGLPKIYPEDIDKIGEGFGYDYIGEGTTVDLEGTYDSPDGKRCAHGSYHRLKALACGFVSEGMSLETAVLKLLKYDDQHHKPFGYFEDGRSHADFGADPYSNCARFYANILKSVNQNRIRRGLTPQIPSDKEEIELDLSALTPIVRKKTKDFVYYPEPRGLMKDFVHYCELMGKGRQDALGLGGALILMAGLCSNRYASKVRGLPVTPNLYVMNLGYSSFGKDVSQRLLDDLLDASGMVGSANYRSGTSMVQSLPEQQERVDLIDECSWLLKAMMTGDNYQSEMVEILSLLFSRAGSRFNGIASAKEGARHGAVWNPHVSILASTTPVGFKESVNSAMAAKGLMPRFLTFFQKEIGDYKGETDLSFADKLMQNLKDGCAFHFAQEKKYSPNATNYMATRQGPKGRDDSMGFRYKPLQIPFEANAHKLWIEYEKKNHYKSAKDPDEFESPFYGRFAELAAKVALLDTLSLGQSEIQSDNLEWAIKVVETCWKNVQPMYQLATAQNTLEGNHLRVMAIVEDNDGLIQKEKLTAKTRWMKRRERDEILETLTETGKLKKVSLKDPKNLKQKKPAVYYSTIEVFNATRKNLQMEAQ